MKCIMLLLTLLFVPLWIIMTEQFIFFMIAERYSFIMCYLVFNLWLFEILYVVYLEVYSLDFLSEMSSGSR